MLGSGRYAVTDRTWASHLLALERAGPERSFVAAGEALPLLRAVKDPDEIERLRVVAHAADAAFADVISLPFAGRAEAEVAAELDRLLREHGHERVDFTIVGSGPNARLGPPRAGGATDRAGRRRRDGLRRDARRLLLGHHPDRVRRRAHGRGTRGLRDRPGGPAGGVRGGAPGRRGRGRRPGGAGGHHRRGLRRTVRPPDGPRDRPRGPRTPLHRGGQRDAARAGDDLLGRAGDLPGGAVRRPDRGPGRGDAPRAPSG